MKFSRRRGGQGIPLYVGGWWCILELVGTPKGPLSRGQDGQILPYKYSAKGKPA